MNFLEKIGFFIEKNHNYYSLLEGQNHGDFWSIWLEGGNGDCSRDVGVDYYWETLYFLFVKIKTDWIFSKKY